jgi:hypothetical protein
MPFDWKEYHTIAKFLHGDAPIAVPTEASCRSAVSRYYYSAFGHLRNFARDHQKFMPRYSDEDHYLLRDHFKKQKGGLVSKYLGDLRLWRNQCDYDDVLENDEDVYDSAMKAADKIFKIFP